MVKRRSPAARDDRFDFAQSRMIVSAIEGFFVLYQVSIVRASCRNGRIRGKRV